MKFKKYQLKNGLTVLLVESHKSPVITCQTWVRTGSADEKKGEEGISHFIEHLVFKGSEKFKVGEIAAKVEGDGGELNAYTSFDQTVFHVTISKAFKETGLNVLSQMLGFPSFDKKEIDNEREVVIEEIKRSEDNPHRQASRLLFSTVYRKHPYGIPVIGYADNIRKVSKKTLVEYYNRRYTPENMTILVVGDFTNAEIKPLVKKYFEVIPRTKLKKVARAKEPKQLKTRTKVYKGPFEEQIMHLAWRTPSATHKDTVALDVLSMILGAGESSRLMRALRIENNLTSYAVASNFSPKDQGFFAISLSLLPDKIDEALDELVQQLGSILREAPSQEELHKIVTNLESDEYYSTQTVDGMAQKFGAYEDLFKDYKYYKKFLGEVLKLKPVDITKVARKYLKPDSLTAVMLTKEDEKTANNFLKSFVKKYRAEYKKSKSKKITEGKIKRKKSLAWRQSPKKKDLFKKYELKSGASIVFQTNTDTPVVSLKSAFLGGMRCETDAVEGMTEALARTWVSNTKNMSESAMHKKMDSLASNLSAFGGRNTVGLGFTTLAPVSEEILDIYEQVLLDAEITDDIVEREVEHIKEQLKSRSDNPAQICMRNFSKEMFQGHPYSLDPLGNFSTIEQISADKVKSHLEKMRFAKNLDIVAVGDIDSEHWLDRFEKMTAKLPSGNQLSNTFEFNKPKEDKQVFHELKKEQTHIVLGYPGLTFTSEDRYALHLIQAILSGQGGRLFYELRDKESLAYTVSPLRLEGVDAGYFGAYIACSPEKSKKAIEMLKAEFNKLCETKVGEDEIEKAKRNLIGRHDIALQKPSAIATSILFDDIYGLPYNETYHFGEKIQEINSEQILNLSARLFEQPEVISVVGSSRPW